MAAETDRDIASIYAPRERTCPHCGTTSQTRTPTCPECGKPFVSYEAGKMAPRTKQRLIVGGVVALIAIVVAAILLAPGIDKHKRQQSAAASASAARHSAQEAARLKRQSRPRTGSDPAAAKAGQQALITAVEAAITKDALARHGTKELPQVTRRTDCKPYRSSKFTAATREAGLDCTAVTNDVPSTPGAPAGILGYQYWARADFTQGTWAFCLLTRPGGERGIGTGTDITVPKACDASL